MKKRYDCVKLVLQQFFYSNYLMKKTNEKQQANMIIITVVKEQRIMNTGSLRSKREVINEDTKKLKNLEKMHFKYI